MTNNIKTVTGNYLKSEDFKYYFSSGVNIVIKGQKAFVTFFNEVPSKSEQFELNLDDNGFVVNQRDLLPSGLDTERIQQCTIEMDLEVAKQLFSFLSDNLKGVE